MRHEMFTHSWAVAWGEAIRANEAYREAARTWEWPIVLMVKEDPGLGVPERSVYVDLFRGECRAARVATPDDLETVPYILVAEVRSWKRLLDGEIETISGIMRGKLKLARGSLASLLPHVQAAKQLVVSATRVETLFPEGI
jgi:putative sterol carrier protein